MQNIVINIPGCCPAETVAWEPSSLDLQKAFGYSTLGKDWGATSITFNGESSISGFVISNQLTLASLAFPNLVSTGNLWSSSNPVLTSVSAPVLVTADTVQISANSSLTSLIFPKLTTLSADWVSNVNPLLASISLPLLTTVGFGGFSAVANPVFHTLSLPALVSLGFTLNLSTCPALANLILPSYVPTNGRQHNISGAALTATSVNLLLARAVANAAYVSGTINVSGGTSSAPTGQGITDKATLIARGVTVTTN